MSNSELIDFIATIPDLTAHRFIDTDGEFSVKMHSAREVAERVVQALTTERGLQKIDFDDPEYEGSPAPFGEWFLIKST